MLKKIFKGAIIAAVALFASCTEDIDKSNRYTFKEETLQSYLQNRPEFSHLIDIFKRANMMGTLGTYGEHTLFAPTNAAIERYLFEQDSIWQATKDTEEPVWTGITSPYLEELSDSMANVIAKSHLIPEKYETIDMTWETMPTQNYNKRYISLNTSSDSNGYHIYIENKAEIVIGDELVENGVIHIVSHVVEQTTNTLYEHIASYPYFSIFAEAIERTGYDQTMLGYVDESYDLQFVEATPYRTYEGTGYARHPQQKRDGYSAFVPYDSILISKYNINNIDDLIAKAQQWYGTEDANDYTSPKNALNKLVAYHLLDCDVPYDKLVIYKLNLGDNFKSEWAFMAGYDRMDYFVTKNNLIIKAMRALSKNESKIRVNPSNRNIPITDGMQDHINVLVYSPSEFTAKGGDYAAFLPNALNGTIHPIDGLLVYNVEEMERNVLYERMRFDFATLLPELMTNAVRYTTKKESGSTYQAGNGMATAGDINIPDGYCKNLKINNPLTHLHYFTPWDWGVTLNGDEFIASGQYDFEYRLPPVPAGTYELRLGYTATEVRSITQFYVRKGSENKAEICGIPVDLRIFATDSRIGWIKDSETTDDGVENDKTMRNHGYMKAPLSMADYVNHKDGNNMSSARHYSGAIRYIVTTSHFEGYDNWIRMKNVMEDNTKEGMHDYIELVPIGIVNDDINLEDRE